MVPILYIPRHNVTLGPHLSVSLVISGPQEASLAALLPPPQGGVVNQLIFLLLHLE